MLSPFLDVSEDFDAVHVALWAAIYAAWEEQAFQNPFNVSRSRLMKKSRIRTLGTYHRCIKDFMHSGYITYKPSYHPRHGSQMWVLNQE